VTATPDPRGFPPPGWYPDPADATQERYWEGQQWSRSVRPLTPPAPASQYGGQFGYGPDGGSAHSYGQPAYPVPQQAQPLPPNPYVNPATGQPYGAATPVPMTADGVPLAGWGHRLASSLIDALLLWVLAATLTSALTPSWVVDEQMRFMEAALAYLRNPSGVAPTIGHYDIMGPLVILVLVEVLITAAYTALMLRFRGATLGQLALRLRTVPVGVGRAARLGWGRAITKGLVWGLLSRVSPLYLVTLFSILMPLWDKRRQTLHDKIARTQVVRLG